VVERVSRFACLWIDAFVAAAATQCENAQNGHQKYCCSEPQTFHDQSPFLSFAKKYFEL